MTAFAVSDDALVTQVPHPTVPVVVMTPPVNGEVKVMLVTLPPAAGVAQVPSPRQNVDAFALVPLLRLVTGRLPVTSVTRLTAPNDGSPTALPCKTVVVVPSDASTVLACPPLPTIKRFTVSAAALVTQVKQVIVPLVVIVPPPMGEVVAMDVTVPVPGGVAQVLSPRQKVVAEAPDPLFRFATGRFPVTPPAADEARLMTGISADTSDRNVGAAAAPVEGPA
jgi:hypothetical protein